MQHNMNPQNEFLKRNEQLWMRPGRLYIPAWQFSGIDYETTTATDLKSMGTGAANDTAVAEQNTSGVTGVSFGANANSLEHFLAIPPDMDLSHPIYFSVVWVGGTGSSTVTWTVLYKTYIANSTTLGAAPAATALSAAIAADTNGTAFQLMVTNEGRLNGGALADTTEFLQLGVVRTAASAVPILLGLNIRYTRKLLQYGSMKAEAKPATYIASEKYAN